MNRFLVSMLMVFALLEGLPASGAEAQVDSASTIQYLLARRKPDGAFGPVDQEHSDLAWNYPAVHALNLLKVDIPRADDCLKNGQWAAFRQKDAHRTNLHWDLYQKTHLNLLLAPKLAGPAVEVFPGQRRDGGSIQRGKRWTLRYKERKAQYYGPYGVGVFHDIPSLWCMTDVLTALDGAIVNPDFASDYLQQRQAADWGLAKPATATHFFP